MRALLLGLLLLVPIALGSATTHMAWDGQTATVVCPILPRNVQHPGCIFAEEPAGTWTEIAVGATRVEGELTWTPRTAAQRSMHVFVFGLRADGMPVDGVLISGSGPIAWDADLTAIAGVRHAVSIHADFREVRLSTLGAVAEVGQPFLVEMTVTT